MRPFHSIVHSVGAEVETGTEEEVPWAPQPQGQHVNQSAQRRHHYRMPYEACRYAPCQILPRTLPPR